MTFKCKKCSEEVSNSKMAGLVFGQIAAATLEGKGVKTQRELAAGFNSGEFGSGFLSAFRVKCPSCEASNWEPA